MYLRWHSPLCPRPALSGIPKTSASGENAGTIAKSAQRRPERFHYPPSMYVHLADRHCVFGDDSMPSNVQHGRSRACLSYLNGCPCPGIIHIRSSQSRKDQEKQRRSFAETTALAGAPTTDSLPAQHRKLVKSSPCGAPKGMGRRPETGITERYSKNWNSEVSTGRSPQFHPEIQGTFPVHALRTSILKSGSVCAKSIVRQGNHV